MEQINSEILRQFKAKGISINEGIAVDARLKGVCQPAAEI